MVIIIVSLYKFRVERHLNQIYMDGITLLQYIIILSINVIHNSTNNRSLRIVIKCNKSVMRSSLR